MHRCCAARHLQECLGVLQCVAVYCSMLQCTRTQILRRETLPRMPWCVAMCCSVLQYVAGHTHTDATPQDTTTIRTATHCNWAREHRCSAAGYYQGCLRALQRGSMCCSVLVCVAVWYYVLQCNTMCCSVVLCVAVWHNVLQYTHTQILRRETSQGCLS